MQMVAGDVDVGDEPSASQGDQLTMAEVFLNEGLGGLGKEITAEQNKAAEAKKTAAANFAAKKAAVKQLLRVKRY